MAKTVTRFIWDLRPLSSADMATILAPVARNSISPDRIRQTHHRIAILFASGLRAAEVAQRCGYTLNYLNALAGTPAIKDLITKYAEKIQANAVVEAATELAIGQSALAMAERQRMEQLEEADFSGEKIPLRLLNAICADGQDRYGTPRKSTNFNVNANFGEELEKALARSAQVGSPAPAAAPTMDLVPKAGTTSPKAGTTAPEPEPRIVPDYPAATPFRRRI